jgi:hypothetical protein
MGRGMPGIYAVLDNKKDEFPSYLIEVEGNIDDQPITILIDSGASHIYIDPNLVERFHLQIRKIGKSWLVQLATGAKRIINELVKECLIVMNGLSTKADLNISYICIYMIS